MVNTMPLPDALPPPKGCTNFKLRSLMRRVAQHYDAELAACGLKTTQYTLLSCVYKLGPVQPSQLARTMSLEASTLTRNLRPLIEAGWLRLEPGQDARTRRVVLTETGVQKRMEAQRCWRSAQNSLNQRLGPDTVSALHQLLDACLEHFEDP